MRVHVVAATTAMWERLWAELVMLRGGLIAGARAFGRLFR